MIPPTSLQSVYEDQIEKAFASSPTLQRSLKKTTEEICRYHIFNDYSLYISTTGHLENGRPAIVIDDPEYMLTRDSMNADRSQGNLTSGAFEILISADSIYPGTDDAVNHKESRSAFVNFVGGIIDDVSAVAGVSSNMGFETLSRTSRHERTPVGKRSETHDIWEVVWRWEFNAEPA